MNSLFWSQDALKLEREVNDAMRPIVEKYAAKGYSIREVIHVLMNSSLALECELVLGRQIQAHREREARKCAG